MVPCVTSWLHGWMDGQGVSRLRAKVESAGEMPILEFGADCQALMDRAVKALRDRAAKARMGTILDR